MKRIGAAFLAAAVVAVATVVGGEGSGSAQAQAGDGPCADREVHLSAGFNLIGWTGAATSVAEATAGIAGDFDALFVHDPSAPGGFLSYRPDLPAGLNSLATLPQNEPLWIDISAPGGVTWAQAILEATARTVPLDAGWNLILWTGPDGTPVEEAIAGIAAAVQSLYVWDPLGPGFMTYTQGLPPSIPQSLDSLSYGSGVWLLMHDEADWQISAPGIACAGPVPHLFFGSGDTGSGAVVDGQLVPDGVTVEAVNENGDVVGSATIEGGVWLVEVDPALATRVTFRVDGSSQSDPYPIIPGGLDEIFLDLSTGATADVEITLTWNTQDDVDLGLVDWPEQRYWAAVPELAAICSLDGDDDEDPNGFEIISCTGLPGGEYAIYVNLFERATAATTPIPFTVRLTIDGQPQTFQDAVTVENPFTNPASVVLITTFAVGGVQPPAGSDLLAGAVEYEGPYPEPATVTYTADGETVEVTAYPGQVLVFFSTSIAASDAQEIITGNGGAVLGKIPNLGLYLVGVSPGEEGAFISALTADPAVLDARPHGAIDLVTPSGGTPGRPLEGPIFPAEAALMTVIDDCGGVQGLAVGGAATAASGPGVSAACADNTLGSGGPIEFLTQFQLAGIAGERAGQNTFINISSGPGLRGGDWNDLDESGQVNFGRANANYIRGLLRTIAALPESDRENLVVTFAAGNENAQLGFWLETVRIDPRLADILKKHFLIVGAPENVYPESNDFGNDPDVALMPSASCPFTVPRGTSCSAPQALGLIQQVAQETGLSGKDALRAAKRAIAANPNHILDLDEALAEARAIQREEPPVEPPVEPPDDYAPDPVLAALRDACLAGDMGACDSLFFQAPTGSDLQAIGDTCGNTRASGSGGTCAGEAVGTGAVQVTLSWAADLADVDLYVTDPSGEQIYYGHPSSASGGQLDVDDTNGYGPENIFWPEGGAPSGAYTVEVRLFSTHEAALPIRFTVTVNVGGVAQSFSGTLSAVGQTVIVTTFTVP